MVVLLVVQVKERRWMERVVEVRNGLQLLLLCEVVLCQGRIGRVFLSFGMLLRKGIQ